MKSFLSFVILASVTVSALPAMAGSQISNPFAYTTKVTTNYGMESADFGVKILGCYVAAENGNNIVIGCKGDAGLLGPGGGGEFHVKYVCKVAFLHLAANLFQVGRVACADLPVPNQP